MLLSSLTVRGSISVLLSQTFNSCIGSVSLFITPTGNAMRDVPVSKDCLSKPKDAYHRVLALETNGEIVDFQSTKLTRTESNTQLPAEHNLSNPPRRSPHVHVQCGNA